MEPIHGCCGLEHNEVNTFTLVLLFAVYAFPQITIKMILSGLLLYNEVTSRD